MRSRQTKVKRGRNGSCGFCKPHKNGIGPKDSNKYQAAELAAKEEVDEYDPDELVSILAMIAANEAMAS